MTQAPAAEPTLWTEIKEEPPQEPIKEAKATPTPRPQSAPAVSPPVEPPSVQPAPPASEPVPGPSIDPEPAPGPPAPVTPPLPASPPAPAPRASPPKKAPSTKAGKSKKAEAKSPAAPQAPTETTEEIQRKVQAFRDAYLSVFKSWEEATDYWILGDINKEVTDPPMGTNIIALPHSDDSSVLNEWEGRYLQILKRVGMDQVLEASMQWASILPQGVQHVDNSFSINYAAKRWKGFAEKLKIHKEHQAQLNHAELRKYLAEGMVQAALLIADRQKRINKLQDEIHIREKYIEKEGAGFWGGFWSVAYGLMSEPRAFSKEMWHRLTPWGDPNSIMDKEQEKYITAQFKEIKERALLVQGYRIEISHALSAAPPYIVLTHTIKSGGVEKPFFMHIDDLWEKTRAKAPLEALPAIMSATEKFLVQEAPNAVKVIEKYGHDMMMSLTGFFAPLAFVREQALGYVETISKERLAKFERANTRILRSNGFTTANFESITGEEMITAMALATTTTSMASSTVLEYLLGKDAQAITSKFIQRGAQSRLFSSATAQLARRAAVGTIGLVAGGTLTAGYLGLNAIQKTGYQNFVKSMLAQSVYVGATSYDAALIAQHLSTKTIAYSALWQTLISVVAGQRIIEGSKVFQIMRGRSVTLVNGERILVNTTKGAAFKNVIEKGSKEVARVVEAGKAKAVLEAFRPTFLYFTKPMALFTSALYGAGSVATMVYFELITRGYSDFKEAWTKDEKFQKDIWMTFFADGFLALYGGTVRLENYWHFASLVALVTMASSLGAQLLVGGDISMERLTLDGAFLATVSPFKFLFAYRPIVDTMGHYAFGGTVRLVQRRLPMLVIPVAASAAVLDWSNKFLFSVVNNYVGNAAYITTLIHYKESEVNLRRTMMVQRAAQEASRR